MIGPETDSTSSSEATSDRQDCGGSGASEQEESSGLEHGKFSLWLRSIVAHYPAKGKHLVGLALVVDGDRELRSSCGCGLRCNLSSNHAEVTHQQLSSADLALT